MQVLLSRNFVVVAQAPKNNFMHMFLFLDRLVAASGKLMSGTSRLSLGHMVFSLSSFIFPMEIAVQESLGIHLRVADILSPDIRIAAARKSSESVSGVFPKFSGKSSGNPSHTGGLA